jgi:PAS domain S-box-containing protein/putative nucleotidyltransferase with HDIG domain
VYWLAKPQRDNTGRIVRYVGVNLDITERTRAEQALERERRDYQTIIDAAPVMIAYKSADDHFVHVNAAFAEFVGLPVEKIIGMTTFDLVKQPAVAEQGRAHDLQVIRTGEPVVNQLAYWSGFRSNREIWTLYSKYPFYDATGNAIGTVSFVVDVNDRVRAEQALRASEVLMRTIAENYPNSYVSIIEKDLTIGFTSGQEFKKQNLDPHQFVGLPLEPVFGEHAPFVREKYLETFGGAETQFELFINAQHQLYRTVPLRDSNGDIQQILVVVENITERKRAEEHLLQRTAQLAALHEIDLAISNTFDLRITLDILLRQVVAQLQVDAATVLLVNPHLHLLEYAAGFGFRYPTIQKSRVHLGEGCAGRAALERQIISGTIGAPDRADCQRLRVELADENFVTHHIAPLIVKGQVKGVLEIFQRTRREPANEWLDFFQVLAGQAAIGVDSALLFEGLQRSNAELALSYDATLEGWSRALDLRDQETEGHSQRVTEMAVRLARAMGMNDAELVHVRRGALLHDIGKLGVPDSILFKPDALTDAEWQVMRRHPKLAFDLIAPIVYLRPALDIPYCHHEKWDGSGYPRRLRGEHIPLAARVFAVVDVWDALRSNRAYRQAWSAEQTRAYLREQAGKYFDPRVVHAFLELVADVG